MKWERVELGEVVEITSGGAFKSKLFNKENKGLPLVRIRNVGMNSTDTYYSGDYDSKYLINNEDLLIAMDGEFRVEKWLGGEALLNQRVCKIDAASNDLDRNYLYRFLPFELKKIEDRTSFVTVKHLSVKEIKGIQIPLPPLSEQRRLAARLDKADALRQKSRAVVEAYAELGRSVFLEVFGDPVRNERGWDVVELIDHVKILGGGTPSKKNKSFYTGNIPWVSPKDMKSIFIDSSIDKITKEAIENSSTKLIPKDSVLMVVRSGILKKQLPVGINICPVTLNQDMKAFVCKKKLNPYYLLYLFLVLAPNILKSVRGTTADNISSDVLKKLQIPLPPLPLQSRFAAMVTNIEAQRRLAERQLSAAEAVFGGVLQGTFEM
jgi:type I restriction enzyme S subunit